LSTLPSSRSRSPPCSPLFPYTTLFRSLLFFVLFAAGVAFCKVLPGFAPQQHGGADGHGGSNQNDDLHGKTSFCRKTQPRARSCQKATALAAAKFRLSTPWDMGILAV